MPGIHFLQLNSCTTLGQKYFLRLSHIVPCFCVNVQFSYTSECSNDKGRKSEKEYNIDEENVPGEDAAMSARPPARSCNMIRKRELFYTQVILQCIIKFVMPTTSAVLQE